MTEEDYLKVKNLEKLRIIRNLISELMFGYGITSMEVQKLGTNVDVLFLRLMDEMETNVEVGK